MIGLQRNNVTVLEFTNDSAVIFNLKCCNIIIYHVYPDYKQIRDWWK